MPLLGDEKPSNLPAMKRLLLLQPRTANPDEAGSRLELSDQLSQRLLEDALSGEDAAAWKVLGDIADAEKSNGSRISNMELSAGVVALHRKLAQLLAEDRYDLLLKWTLPDADRKVIRCLQVLAGDWPEQIPDDVLQNSVAAGEAPSKERSQALTQAFGDHFLAENVDFVRRRAKAMSSEERYRFLSDWVLAAAEQSKAGRILVGGSFSAAFDLVHLARTESARRAAKSGPAG